MHERQKDSIVIDTHREMYQTSRCYNLCEYGSLRDSDVEKEMNNVAPVPTSSEMRNVMKRKFNSLPISNQLQKEDRDSVLCRLDKVFKSNGIVNDEAHFWLNGYVNKQNCRIWSEANPQVYVETPLHPEKLTVWCALWAGGILLQKR
ncbi:hypothetical protein TNCV_1328541 [Trichonephila clavipes]|nr:hypothetical protein TNCV_1328541 [Trichonephila clavipes]